MEQARKALKEYRSARDKNREDAFKMLNTLTNDSLNASSLFYKNSIILAKNLIEEHVYNEKETIRLYQELKKVKNANKIRGFKTLNSFLMGIGNPILIAIIGFFFLLMHLRRNKINWKVLPRAYFLSASIICLSISFVYTIWAMVDESDIPRFYYAIIGVLCSFAIVYTSKYLNKKMTSAPDEAKNTLKKFLSEKS